MKIEIELKNEYVRAIWMSIFRKSPEIFQIMTFFTILFLFSESKIIQNLIVWISGVFLNFYLFEVIVEDFKKQVTDRYSDYHLKNLDLEVLLKMARRRLLITAFSGPVFLWFFFNLSAGGIFNNF